MARKQKIYTGNDYLSALGWDKQQPAEPTFASSGSDPYIYPEEQQAPSPALPQAAQSGWTNKLQDAWEGVKNVPSALYHTSTEIAGRGMQAFGENVVQPVVKPLTALYDIATNPNDIAAGLSDADRAKVLASHGARMTAEQRAAFEPSKARFSDEDLLTRAGRQSAQYSGGKVESLYKELEPGGVGQMVQGGLVSAGQNVANLAAAYMTGGASAAPALVQNLTLALMGVQSGLQTYGEKRDKGFSKGQAAIMGGGAGGLEVATEKAPLGKFMDLISPDAKRGVASFIKRLGEYGLQEIGGEMINTLVGDVLYGKMTSRPDITPEEAAKAVSNYFSSGEFEQAMKQTVGTTLVQTGAMGGGALMLRRLAREHGAKDNTSPSTSTPDLDLTGSGNPTRAANAALEARDLRDGGFDAIAAGVVPGAAPQPAIAATAGPDVTNLLNRYADRSTGIVDSESATPQDYANTQAAIQRREVVSGLGDQLQAEAQPQPVDNPEITPKTPEMIEEENYRDMTAVVESKLAEIEELENALLQLPNDGSKAMKDQQKAIMASIALAKSQYRVAQTRLDKITKDREERTNTTEPAGVQPVAEPTTRGEFMQTVGQPVVAQEEIAPPAELPGAATVTPPPEQQATAAPAVSAIPAATEHETAPGQQAPLQLGTKYAMPESWKVDETQSGFTVTNSRGDRVAPRKGKWNVSYMMSDGKYNADTDTFDSLDNALEVLADEDGTALAEQAAQPVAAQTATPAQAVAAAAPDFNGATFKGTLTGKKAGGQPTYTVQMNGSRQNTLEEMRAAIAAGQAGGRGKIETDGTGGTGETFGYSSSFPEYFRNKGYTKDAALSAIIKAQSGSGLTRNQLLMLDDMAGELRRQQVNEVLRIRSERLAQRLEDDYSVERDILDDYTAAVEAAHEDAHGEEDYDAYPWDMEGIDGGGQEGAGSGATGEEVRGAETDAAGLQSRAERPAKFETASAAGEQQGILLTGQRDLTKGPGKPKKDGKAVGTADLLDGFTPEEEEAGLPFSRSDANTPAPTTQNRHNLRVMELIADGASVNDILAYIAKEHGQPVYRSLAKALQALNIKADLEAANLRFDDASQNAQGLFHPPAEPGATPLIQIHHNGVDAVRVFLHELLHAATYRAVHSGTTEAKLFISRLKTIKKQAREALEQRGENPEDWYGLQDKSHVEEFVAEVFTNVNFRNMLDSLKVDTAASKSVTKKLTSLFDRVVSAVRSLLKDQAPTGVVKEVMEIGTGLMALNEQGVTNRDTAAASRLDNQDVGYTIESGATPHPGAKRAQATDTDTDVDRPTMVQRAHAVIDRLRNNLFDSASAMGRGYMAIRYRANGLADLADAEARALYDRMVKFRDDRDTIDQLFEYLTTKDADPNAITNPEARGVAIDAKAAIMRMGRRLVAKKLMKEETLEKREGEYLPRLYLKHMLGDTEYNRMVAATRAGSKTLDLSYLKERTDIPKEIREAILGEIKDPAFLVYMAIARPGRDLAIHQWMADIAANRSWVQPKLLVDWNINERPTYAIGNIHYTKNADGTYTIIERKPEMVWTQYTALDEKQMLAGLGKGSVIGQLVKNGVGKPVPGKPGWKRVGVVQYRKDANTGLYDLNVHQREITEVVHDSVTEAGLADIVGERRAEWMKTGIITNKRGSRPVRSIGGKEVTPFYLASEAQRMREMAEVMPDDGAKAFTLRTAERMSSLAIKTLQAAGYRVNESGNIDPASIPDGWAQVPNTAKYGPLRGLVVRKPIHNDIVGYSKPGGVGDTNFVMKFLGEGGFLWTYHRIWKAGKTTYNPGTHAANFMSNMTLAYVNTNMSFYEVPKYLVRAITSITEQDRFYRTGLIYGFKSAGFNANEMGRIKTELLDYLRKSESGKIHPMVQLKYILAKIHNLTGDAYQLGEQLAKTMVLIYRMEHDKVPAAEAAIDAHSALFDYSDISASLRYLREHPLGGPFLTYFAKITGQTFKNLLRDTKAAGQAVMGPGTWDAKAFAAWRASSYTRKLTTWTVLLSQLPTIVASTMGIGDDEYEELRKKLPKYMQARGNLMLMPWRDEDGRFHFLDISRWNPTDPLFSPIKGLANGLGVDAVKPWASMVLGGPLAQVVSVWQTGVDPFTGREINPKSEALTPSEKIANLLEYTWNLHAPSMVGTKGGAGSELFGAITDRVNPKTGEPSGSLKGAIASIGGASFKAINAEMTADQQLIGMVGELNKIKASANLALRNRNLDKNPAEKERLRNKWRAKIQKKAQEIKDFKASIGRD